MKERVVFITIFDMTCYGIRLLSSIAKNCGLDPYIIHLKREKYAPLFKKKDEYKTYQFHYNGLLRGSFYAVDEITDIEVQLLLDTLEKISPSVICLSTRSFALGICQEIFPEIKKRFPHVSIVGGGWGPTLEPEKFLQFCDYVCIGEGERTIPIIGEALKQKRSFNNILNLVYKRGNRFVWNKVDPALSIDELNKLPYPDFSSENKYLISNNKCLPGRKFYNNKVYDLFAGRGCPMNCTYCLSGKYSDIYKKYSGKSCKKYRMRNVEIVLDEVKAAKDRGARFIRFRDEVFPISSQWVSTFLQKYPEEIGLPFFAYVRPEFHNPKTIKKLKDAGLAVTIVGIQSGSQEILKSYNRNLSKDQIIQFAKTLKELKMEFVYHFIYGNPFEREHNLSESLDFSYQLPYRKPFFFKLEPFPGTAIKETIEKKQPVAIPDRMADWYTILQCMSLNGPFLRWLARFIYKHNLLKKIPFTLSVFFIPSLIKEVYTIMVNKFFLKAPFYYFRVKK